jgi:hypothetical protein
MSVILVLMAPFVLLFLYFVPAVVSFTREHPQHLAIFVLNLLLGWTAIGWIIALVWACTNTGLRARA